MKLYQKSSTGKTKFLDIYTQDAQLIREWGILGGKKQKTVKICQAMNVGKANELSSAEQAKAEMKAKIALKMKEGYTKEKPNGDSGSKNKSIDLDKIPSNFCPDKPISECPAQLLNSLETIAQRKHDGHCVFLVKGRKTWHIYSRRMEDLTPHCGTLPFILVQLGKLSSGDFVLCEVTFYHNEIGKEIPRFVSRVIRNEDPGEALVRYAELSKSGVFSCRPFDILFRKNVFVGDRDYTDRHSILHAMKLTDIPDILEWKGPESELVKKAKDDLWEGFVLRTKDAKSHIGYSMDGKAHRHGSYKFKFTKTDDFVVDEALYGISGKHSHFFSKFHIINYELDNTGQAIPVDRGYIGPGTLSHEQLEELTNELNSGKRKLPFVVEVEYQSVHDDTGKLQFGIIQRLREDKKAEECISDN